MNGPTGISVSMATNIPPHNLAEVCNGIMRLTDHYNAMANGLLRIVRGSDFSIGGIIHGCEGHLQYVGSGCGRILMRAHTSIEGSERGRMSIIGTVLPYQANKVELTRNKKIDGLAEVRDKSNRQGMRIVIDLKRDSVPESVLNALLNRHVLGRFIVI